MTINLKNTEGTTSDSQRKKRLIDLVVDEIAHGPSKRPPSLLHNRAHVDSHCYGVKPAEPRRRDCDAPTSSVYADMFSNSSRVRRSTEASATPSVQSIRMEDSSAEFFARAGPESVASATTESLASATPSLQSFRMEESVLQPNQMQPSVQRDLPSVPVNYRIQILTILSL